VKRSIGIAAFIICVLLCWPAAPAGAQTTATTAARSVPDYDASKEVTITGTISSVVKKPTGQMIPGGHLIVSTAEGSVDAHVGKYALLGRNPIAVKEGDTVKMVGETTTINHSSVFLVRTIEDEGHTYTIRNKNGFLLAQSSVHRGSTTAPKGGL